MKIAVLTSSRADFSIYLPLIKRMQSDRFFKIDVIAFGTHLSEKHGYTLDAMKRDGVKAKHTVHTLQDGDLPQDITQSMARTMDGFASIWKREKHDRILALGDRYEMFAAVASSVPFNIPVAHIHGGETTTGAIDNVFRHAITMMSDLHFACAGVYRNKIISMTGSSKGVFNTGALSIDNMRSLNLLSKEEFKNTHGVAIGSPFILVTFHPETVNFEKNKSYIKELLAVFSSLKNEKFLVTMPNADTMGNMIREELIAYSKNHEHVKTVESLGTIGYLSAMKHCKLMLGNSSSGFVEASYFSKPVVNIGERQNGRILTSNIISVPIKKKSILAGVKKAEKLKHKKTISVYGNGHAAEKIISILKKNA